MLWQPFGLERRWLRVPERDGRSGEGLEYRAVRERNAGIGRRNDRSASRPAARLNEPRGSRAPAAVTCAARRMVMVDWVTMAAWVAASARRTEGSGASGKSSLSSTIERAGRSDIYRIQERHVVGPCPTQPPAVRPGVVLRSRLLDDLRHAEVFESSPSPPQPATARRPCWPSGLPYTNPMPPG